MSENMLTLTSLGDTIKDKIRKTMIDAIPDETLKLLIKKEFDEFFIQSEDRYGSKIPSAFSTLVKKEIELEMHTKIREKVKEAVSHCNYEDDKNGFNPVEAIVKQVAPAAMQGIMQHIANQCVQALRASTF